MKTTSALSAAISGWFVYSLPSLTLIVPHGSVPLPTMDSPSPSFGSRQWFLPKSSAGPATSSANTHETTPDANGAECPVERYEWMVSRIWKGGQEARTVFGHD